MIPIVKQLLKYQNRHDLLNSTILEKFSLQQRITPICAFTDIDDTFIRRSQNPNNHARYQKATKNIISLLKRNAIPVIAVTARDLSGVVEGQSPATDNLPAFDVIASSVGTEIWIHTKENNYVKDSIYESKIAKKSNFSRNDIYHILQQAIGELQEKIPGIYLEFQPRDKEYNTLAYKYNVNPKLSSLTTEDAPQDLKISLEFHGTYLQVCYIKRYLKERLTGSNFEKVKIVISSGLTFSPKKTQFSIDILAASKGNAVSYLKKLLQCKAIAAGDSGNDIDMLLNASDASIIVGGCKIELVEEMEKYSLKKIDNNFSLLEDSNSITNRIIYQENDVHKGPESFLKGFLPLLHYFN